MDTEVVTFQALERAWREAEAQYTREHVMPYLYEEAGRFNILLVDHDPDLGELRLTVDTSEDLELVRKVYAHFGNSDEFSMGEMVALLESHPELRQLNAAVTHKTFKDVDDRA
jgi:spore coat polysaccharide biosynthesis protein SpsF